MEKEENKKEIKFKDLSWFLKIVIAWVTLGMVIQLSILVGVALLAGIGFLLGF